MKVWDVTQLPTGNSCGTRWCFQVARVCTLVVHWNFGKRRGCLQVSAAYRMVLSGDKGMCPCRTLDLDASQLPTGASCRTICCQWWQGHVGLSYTGGFGARCSFGAACSWQWSVAVQDYPGAEHLDVEQLLQHQLRFRFFFRGCGGSSFMQWGSWTFVRGSSWAWVQGRPGQLWRL